MTWPTIFANLAAGNQPLALFDTMFTQVAQMVAIPCTPSGINSITLSPIGTAPTLPGYQNFSSFRFVAGSTTTGAVSAQFQALANLPVYLSDGLTQASTGNIIATQEYVLVFVQALNGGAGGFFLEAASVPALPTAAGSAVTNLFIRLNGGTPNTQADVSYDELVMNNPAGSPIRAISQAFTINAANVGVVNGLDTGALAVSNWYHVWGISNGATAGGLLSLSSSAPTMPAGYTFKKRLGALRTDASAHFLGTLQKQRRAQYVSGGNGLSAGVPTLITGASGSTSIPTWTAVPVGAFVPPTANGIGVYVTTAGGGNYAIIAPNNSYGTVGSANAPVLAIGTSGGTGPNFSTPAWFNLESTNIYYASTGGTTLLCLGWEDNW